MANAPRGIGTFARQLTERTHGTPTDFAKNHADNGLRHVALLACWQDMEGPEGAFRQIAGGSIPTMQRYADACRAAGLKVWVWGFPWLGHEDAYMEAMTTAARKIGAVGMIHDPEVSYKDAGAKAAAAVAAGGEANTAYKAFASRAQTRAGAKRLMELDRRACEALRLEPSGVTSYGITAFHSLPWDVFADGGRVWGSPQLYTVPPRLIAKGLTAWAKHFPHLLPAIPAFGDNSGEHLETYLKHFVAPGLPEIDGFFVWSYPQIDAVEWATLARCAPRWRAE